MDNGLSYGHMLEMSFQVGHRYGVGVWKFGVCLVFDPLVIFFTPGLIPLLDDLISVASLDLLFLLDQDRPPGLNLLQLL